MEFNSNDIYNPDMLDDILRDIGVDFRLLAALAATKKFCKEISDCSPVTVGYIRTVAGVFFSGYYQGVMSIKPYTTKRNFDKFLNDRPQALIS